jgi:hypothetical protein
VDSNKTTIATKRKRRRPIRPALAELTEVFRTIKTYIDSFEPASLDMPGIQPQVRKKHPDPSGETASSSCRENREAGGSGVALVV